VATASEACIVARTEPNASSCTISPFYGQLLKTCSTPGWALSFVSVGGETMLIWSVCPANAKSGTGLQGVEGNARVPGAATAERYERG